MSLLAIGKKHPKPGGSEFSEDVGTFAGVVKPLSLRSVSVAEDFPLFSDVLTVRGLSAQL